MPENIPQEILSSIRRIIRAVELYSRELMSKCGLTGPQLALLREVSLRGDITAVEVSDKLCISEATAAGIIDRLEHAEFITRRRGDDKRKFKINISEKGRLALASAPPALQENFTEQLLKLPEWEQLLLLSSLKRIAAMMSAEDLAAAPHLVPGGQKLV